MSGRGPLPEGRGVLTRFGVWGWPAGPELGSLLCPELLLAEDGTGFLPSSSPLWENLVVGCELAYRSLAGVSLVPDRGASVVVRHHSGGVGVTPGGLVGALGAVGREGHSPRTGSACAFSPGLSVPGTGTVVRSAPCHRCLPGDSGGQRIRYGTCGPCIATEQSGVMLQGLPPPPQVGRGGRARAGGPARS